MGKRSAMHFVCTLDEAQKMTSKHEQFWVSDCGCRERKDGCRQSRHDVCIMFYGHIEGSGGNKKAITEKYLTEIFSEAENKKLVPRPFRNEDRTGIDGICFCCNDCCSYFLDPSEECDKGSFIETTMMNDCTHCGACIDVCYFGARKLKNEKLKIISEKCYGCGLCVNTCPADCIRMIKRN